MTSVQFLQDITWALNSPNLLISSPNLETHSIVSEAHAQILLNDTPFTYNFSKQHKRLGFYFEELIAYALKNNPHYTLIARNLNVYDTHKLQLGEFDFIFEHQNIFHHWEVAVKFYLFHPATQYCYGPNARDRLDIKLDKLFNKQLKLAKHSCTRILLQNKLGIQKIKSAALLKGYLFYPWPTLSQQHTPPQWINPHHLKGWWCYQSDFKQKLDITPKDRRWLILPRLKWLSPIERTDSAHVLQAEALLTLITEHQSPPLIVELEYTDQRWQEISRGFVVPDGWPFSEIRDNLSAS